MTSHPSPPPARDYTVRGGSIRDRDDRSLLLRAINVHGDSKHVPEYMVPLRPDEVIRLRANGFNAVRFLTQWRAIMPARGQLDRDYLRRLGDEIDKITTAGLLVIVDMHQDVWGEPFGNGAPAWACPDELKAGYEPTSPWWLNYLSPQVSACFDELWTDAELRGQLVAAWQAVAETLCDDSSVVGFDLLNEPWPGGSLGVRQFDQLVLYERYYREAMDAIDAVCPGRLFFLEPSRAYDLGLSDPIHFLEADQQRAVLAPHFYPSAVHEEGVGYDGDEAGLRDMFNYLYLDYLDRGVPMWFGEYGGLTDNPNFDVYMEHFLGLLLEIGIGSSLWVYSEGGEAFSFVDADGARKPVFDSTATLPIPTRLPSPARELQIDYGRSAVSLRTDCKKGSGLQWLLPDGPEWQATVEPTSAIDDAAPSAGFTELTCKADGEILIEVAACP